MPSHRSSTANNSVIFLVPYPKEGPSVRLRVEQFRPMLDELGVKYSIRSFLTPYFYKILYKRGRSVQKVMLFLYCSCRRFMDLARALFYDVIFIHREIFPVGPPVFEAILFLFRKKIIFDFDDAIYLHPAGCGKLTAMLKCPWKTNFIIRHSALVIAGNEALRDHASIYNRNITIIPTCIDTDKYCTSKADKDLEGDVVIGWTGSHTTQVFLQEMEPVFLYLLDRYKNLKIHLVGGRLFTVKHDRIISKEWSLDSEKNDVNAFDIGIMPMPDTGWTKGKCGFKAILYMSCGIPVVVSPVGANLKIVDEGVTGYFASNKEDWVHRLAALIEDPALRTKIGENGRRKVLKEYSLEANKQLFGDSLRACFSVDEKA